jgi:hypothetical protein
MSADTHAPTTAAEQLALRGQSPVHIARLGGCAGVIAPRSHPPTEAVAIMTGATTMAKG